MKKYFTLFITLIFYSSAIVSQNTVGTITNEAGVYDGYTLFSPNNSTETYLINNCGLVVKQWTSTFTPAASVYLLENGNLLRTGRIQNSDITFGGVGGKIEMFDWDNNLLWEYTHSSPQFSQHHDIYPLPNGNVLMLAVNTMTEFEAIDAGRDPLLITEGKVFNERIIELQPNLGTDTAEIVWVWNINDHLIQDFDSSKANFGIIADHPELLDFNFLNENNGVANWLHINSMQYNSELDQIILSSRLMDEIYIIDHSTTTAEAASHSGGTYGKGGDFLYRWGNPMAYDKGDITNKTLYSQHYAHWIPNGLTDEGKLMVFNNGNSRRFSSVDIIAPPQITPGVYEYDPISGYGPTQYEWTYVDPIDPEEFFSAILSSGQRLPNGNTLICDGDSGYFFELDPANNIVWEYVNPDSTNGILTQGDTPLANFVFRAIRFSLDYPAFVNRDLTPDSPIELNPNLTTNCTLRVDEFDENALKVFPNPVSNVLTIRYANTIDEIEVYNALGALVKSKLNSNSINVASLSSGVYFIKIKSNASSIVERIIKN